MATICAILRSLDSWVKSRLEKGKGARIPNFGTFTWRIHTSAVTNVASKTHPIFVPDESFCKAFALHPDLGVTLRLGDSRKSLAKVEEINYTRLAIKFSDNLTKDVVFSGSRDMIQHIGRACGTKEKVGIKFSFGRLVSKRRRIRFDFSRDIISLSDSAPNEPLIMNDKEIKGLLQEQEEEGKVAPRSMKENGGDETEERKESELEQTTPVSPISPESKCHHDRDIPPLDIESARKKAAREMKMRSLLRDTGGEYENADGEDELGEDGQTWERSLLFTSSTGPHTNKTNPVAKKRTYKVLQKAFQRHVQAVNERLQEEDQQEQEEQQHLKEKEESDRTRREYEKEVLRLVQKEVVKQMNIRRKECDAERQQSRKEQMTLYPPLQAFDLDLEEKVKASPELSELLPERVKSDPAELLRVSQKLVKAKSAKDLGAFLQSQVSKKLKEKEDAFAKKRAEEREFVKFIERQTKKQQRLERVKKHRQQVTQSKTWEHDRKIRDFLRKREHARRKGLRSAGNNLYQGLGLDDFASGDNTVVPSERSDISVGYDMRTKG